MRRAAAVDRNQSEIVAALRKAGATVQLLHSVGQGCPDLMVGHRGANILMEVKDHAKARSKRGLTTQQVEWHGEWRGQVAVVETVGQALSLIGVTS